MNALPYLYGRSSTRTFPLQEALPDYQTGIAESWLESTVPPGSWVLCPFGSSPQIALEAARAGYRVLLPVHNPILRFLIDQLAAPPSQEDLNSALALLASSYKGKERLKPFLLSLYETDCPHCGARTSATGFIWAKNTRELLRKACSCQTCGEESEAPVTADDIAKAREFRDRSPIHARALTRVSSPTDPIRGQVEAALGSYPPRSVYALFSVLNKLTGAELPPERLTHLEILLLHAFYRCSRPLAGAPPGPLSEEDDAHSTFREENVWYALEEALEFWAGPSQQAAVALWPDSPPDQGGICLFPGRVKELIPQLGGFPIQALVMVFPRPTPSFWGLSALWTGWLWGQEAAAPLRGVLSVHNYDWNWITRAVETTLAELSKVLPGSSPVLGLLPEAEVPYLISAASAGTAAGLGLENLALDPDQRLVQTQWKLSSNPPGEAGALSDRELIRTAGWELLQEAGEPRHDLAVHAAGITSLAEAGYPPAGAEEYYPRLMVDFAENIAYRQGFLHYPEIESWWHLDLALDPLPLSDRVEISLVTLLVKAQEAVADRQLLTALYNDFPGLFTPRWGLIQACLKSYAEHPEGQPEAWALKANDQPSARMQDLGEMGSIIRSIGDQLGCTTREESGPENTIHLVWEDDSGIRDDFLISASGLLLKISAARTSSASRKWLILPGSRAPLIEYKMRHNPPLAESIRGSWQLLKFRHLRRLAEQGGLTRENYLERFSLDPFTSDSRQLLLI